MVYVRALPRLEAEEELRMVRAVSAPWMSERARRAYLERLEGTVSPRERRGLVGSAAVRAWFQQFGLPIGA